MKVQSISLFFGYPSPENFKKWDEFDRATWSSKAHLSCYNSKLILVRSSCHFLETAL